jgi:hypothetical protein
VPDAHQPVGAAARRSYDRRIDRWIGHHFDAIGHRSTIDVKEMFL